MLRVLLFLVPLAMTIYALVDCISSKDEDVRHLPKLVWILLIVLAWIIGPITWILIGRRRGAAAGGRRGRATTWVAPDDNPEFLRSLADGRPSEANDQDRELLEDWEEDLRRREQELRQKEGDDDSPPSGGPKER